MNERAERNITSSGCFNSQLLNLMKTILERAMEARFTENFRTHKQTHKLPEKKIRIPKDRQENTEYEIFNFSFHLIFRAILSFCLFVGHFYSASAILCTVYFYLSLYFSQQPMNI